MRLFSVRPVYAPVKDTLPPSISQSPCYALGNPSGNNYWEFAKCHSLLSSLQIDTHSSLFGIVTGTAA